MNEIMKINFTINIDMNWSFNISVFSKFKDTKFEILSNNSEFSYELLMDENNWQNKVNDAFPDDEKFIENPKEEIDYFLDDLWEGNILSPSDLKKLIEQAENLLHQEPNVLRLSQPITICGDIHGQFRDLLEIFRISGIPPKTQYLFLGDYVDRGANSIQSISFLLALKIKYPDRIFLLRGNHESTLLSSSYGFKDEIISKYGSDFVFRYFNDVFNSFPLAAIISNSIFCIHGGFSRDAMRIKDIEEIFRFQDIPSVSILTDLLWNDPIDEDITFRQSPRNAGNLYGLKSVDQFLNMNHLNMVVRAHQVVPQGYKYSRNSKVLTLFSAPNYDSANKAAILIIDDNGEKRIISYSQVRPKQTKLDYLKQFIY